MNWEPIETAPKDGTHILLYIEGIVIEGFYNNGGWQGGSLSEHGCGCCGSPNDDPTHWMPLPDKPE